MSDTIFRAEVNVTTADHHENIHRFAWQKATDEIIERLNPLDIHRYGQHRAIGLDDMLSNSELLVCSIALREEELNDISAVLSATVIKYMPRTDVSVSWFDEENAEAVSYYDSKDVDDEPSDE